MAESATLWIGFNIFIFVMLGLDLFVFNRKQHTIKVKEALLWTAFWMSLAAIFCFGIWYYSGAEHALEFATGYLIEQSLSVDNLFVILMLFTFFRTPHAFQHKVLFWGILGAIFFRILFILLGVTLIQQFWWMPILLGFFLIFTSIKMIFEKDKEVNPDNNWAIKLFNRMMPVTKFYEGAKFFTRQNNILHATPLFVALIVVETTDIVFAVDSIPAILAISHNPFIVYSSNIFAVLGLRSLYFALAGVMELFHFLHYGLSVILLFIGAKILLAGFHIWEMPIQFALIVVGGILLLSILLSIIFPEKETVPPHHPHDTKDFPVKDRSPKV